MYEEKLNEAEVRALATQSWREEAEKLKQAIMVVLRNLTYKTPAGTTNCRFCDNNMDHGGTFIAEREMHASNCVVHTLRAATKPLLTNAKSIPLNGCPFCGRCEAKLRTVRDGHRIICGNPTCMASGPAMFHGPADMPSSSDRAIKAWNTRTNLNTGQFAPERTT